MTTTTYCEALNPISPDGCFHAPDHEGQHRGWGYTEEGEAEAVYWDERVEFTQAELKIILTLLQPVQQFFPELQAKIEKAVSK